MACGLALRAQMLLSASSVVVAQRMRGDGYGGEGVKVVAYGAIVSSGIQPLRDSDVFRTSTGWFAA